MEIMKCQSPLDLLFMYVEGKTELVNGVFMHLSPRFVSISSY